MLHVAQLSRGVVVRAAVAVRAAYTHAMIEVWKKLLKKEKQAVRLCEEILNMNLKNIQKTADILDYDDLLLILKCIQVHQDDSLEFCFCDCTKITVHDFQK